MLKANEEDHNEPLYGRVFLAAFGTVVVKYFCFDLLALGVVGEGVLLFTWKINP
jgi:hypothetical protein